MLNLLLYQSSELRDARTAILAALLVSTSAARRTGHRMSAVPIRKAIPTSESEDEAHHEHR